MKPSSASSCLRPIFLVLLLAALPSIASAQKKGASAPAPEPKSAPAPSSHPSHPAPAPAPHHEAGGGGSNAHHDEKRIEPEAHRGGPTGNPGPGHSNTSGPANSHSSSGTNTSNRNNSGGNKAPTGKTAANPPTPRITPADPRAPSGLNLRTANNAGAGNKSLGTGAGHTNISKGAGAAGPGNQPGTTRLANGGSKTLHANGSSVERNRAGKVTGVTTAKGATAKMDPRGRAASIHDGKGTTISRGPHGERRIETTRADHSRLVSYGKRGGYVERRFTRGGHEFARRSYFYHGAYYTRVYAPYHYAGFVYYGYIPAYYYVPAFYGWVYNPWPAPVGFVWGWYGAPWYAPYGYYFAPYPVYPAPAFWLADYALAQSLQAAAEEQAESGSLRNESGFVLASAHLAPQNQDKGSPVLTKVLKDQIAEQVKQMIADEKDAASQGNSGGSVPAPTVPPSLDPRFTLFIVASELSLDTDNAACSVTAGDVIQRKSYAPDGDSMLAVEVVSSKNGDCAVGTTSRLKVDDLEEMHDSFRQKVDDGLKSLSENQGKSGIPAGPAANPRQVPEGQAEPDLTVADELKKQQEAADETEKEVEEASSDSGSAD